MNTPQAWSEFAWTAVGTAILTAVLAVSAGLALLAEGPHPMRGQAVAFAATVCLVAAVGGWIVAHWPTRAPSLAVAKGLGAMALRMFLPLAALGWLQSRGGNLREAGADRLVLIFYLALLATDILLHIIGGRRHRGIGGKNAAN